jgi:hypothetical protein
MLELLAGLGSRRREWHSPGWSLTERDSRLEEYEPFQDVVPAPPRRTTRPTQTDARGAAGTLVSQLAMRADYAA